MVPQTPLPPASARSQPWSWAGFSLLLIVELWAAHAIVFFAHEYAHSFVAWVLGWKSNPLALDYARPTPKVVLLQLGINQNVDEVPIFAGGHAVQAGIISLAGALGGNALLTYALSRWGYWTARRRDARGWAMLAYWMCVASAGNLLDYVPVRTFTDGTDLYQDMFAVEKGFSWSPWTLLLVFGIPTAAVLGWFLLRIEPATLGWLFPTSPARRVLMAVLTALILFDFYGAAGLSDSGPISHTLSLVSMRVIGPVVALVTGYASSRVVSDT